MFHIRHIEVLKTSLNIYVMDEKYRERFNQKLTMKILKKIGLISCIIGCFKILKKNFMEIKKTFILWAFFSYFVS